MKSIKDIYVYIICFMQMIFMYLLFLVNDRLNIYSNFVYILISILFLFTLIFIVLKKYNISLYISLLFLISVLFLRRKIIIDDYFNFDIYLDYWFKHIKNDVVFYNILGNVLIFTPTSISLYLYLESLYKTFIIMFLLIIVLEFFQAFFKLGVFDVVDIILNYLGIFLVTLGVYIWERRKLVKN